VPAGGLQPGAQVSDNPDSVRFFSQCELLTTLVRANNLTQQTNAFDVDTNATPGSLTTNGIGTSESMPS